MSQRVVLTSRRGAVRPIEKEMADKAGVEVVAVHCPTEEEVVAGCRNADAAVSVFEPFTRKVIEKLEKCQIISNIGIGYDQIDVTAATEHGICVANTPDYCLEEMSDHAIAFLLACYKKILQVDKAVKQGKWGQPEIRERILQPIRRLQGQTLGLVGFGRIPRTLVHKAQGLGLRVIAYDPYVSKATIEGYYIELVDFDRLLKESDFISVHAALTQENYHIFGLEQFKAMKKTAYFINTARGALVDEDALYTALSQGYIQGAAIDVMEQEPPRQEHPLFKLDNIIITSHVGQFSEEAMAELNVRPMQETLRVLQGEWPIGFVNPQVREKFLARWGKAMK